jgi:hypothetical protein
VRAWLDEGSGNDGAGAEFVEHGQEIDRRRERNGAPSRKDEEEEPWIHDDGLREVQTSLYCTYMCIDTPEVLRICEFIFPGAVDITGF